MGHVADKGNYLLVRAWGRTLSGGFRRDDRWDLGSDRHMERDDFDRFFIGKISKYFEITSLEGLRH